MKNVALFLLLAGCVTQNGGSYIKADGHPSDSRLTLAQCQGEAASAMTDYGLLGSGSTGGAVGWATGLAERSSKETSIMNACMARHGYLAP
jgi:hypothetical protein